MQQQNSFVPLPLFIIERQRVRKKQKSCWNVHTHTHAKRNHMQIYLLRLQSCVACYTGCSGVVVLTWCYQSRWCETASPALPRSACHQRRKPGTHPETAYHHLQETYTHTHHCVKNHPRNKTEFHQRTWHFVHEKEINIRQYYYGEPLRHCVILPAAFKRDET